MAGGLRRTLQGLIVGAAAAVLAAALWLPGFLDLFESKTWDMRARLLVRPGTATDQVVTVLINQQDLNWAKTVNGWSYPWPREAYAAVASFCRRGGAKALVLDLIFTEPSAYGVGDDEAFAGGLAESGSVIGTVNLAKDKEQGPSTQWPPEATQKSLAIVGLDQWLRQAKPKAFSFPFAQFPIPELSRSAALLANTNLPPDDVDLVYRREPLFSGFAGRIVPSEALGAWLVGNPAERSFSIAPGSLVLGGRQVPIDSEGRAILRYRAPAMRTSYPASAVIQSEIQLMNGDAPGLDPAVLKGKYVFFGVAAPGLYDLKTTPMSGLTPGVEVIATMLDNLLSKDFMRPVGLLLTLALLLVLCVGAGIAVSSVSGAARNALIYVVFIPLAPALSIAAYALGFWLQMVALELGTVFSLVGASLASYATEGQQKRYLKSAFRQYLSPTWIEELIAHPERLRLGGERRELSIFFSDVQGFTGISEALSPEDLTALLNEYLSAMTDIIQEEGGTIDKYEGDAIIAFWNAPLPQPDHAVRSVRAALRCQARLAEMRPGFHARLGKDMFVRVGINSGPAVVGNMGSRTRFDYTMLGDQVNLASRLEGINKQFGTYTMISAAVVEKIGGAYPVRELSRVAVVGRKEPVTVYEPMLAEEYAARAPQLSVFERGLREYYAGKFADARATFQQIAAVDPAAASYARKCEELAARPSGGAWTGVWVMTEK
jgi:adenylate cyclase